MNYGSRTAYYCEQQPFDFVTPVEDMSLENMNDSVVVPIRKDEDWAGEDLDNLEEFNELTFIWEDWEIAVAFKIGACYWGSSYVLF